MNDLGCISYIRWTSINLDRLRYIHQYILVFSGICRSEPNPCWNWRQNGNDAYRLQWLCGRWTLRIPQYSVYILRPYSLDFFTSMFSTLIRRYILRIYLFSFHRNISKHWILLFLHMRAAWWWWDSLCVLFTICIFPVWRNFHGNWCGNQLFAVIYQYFLLRKRRKRDIPTKSTCWMGRGGGVSRARHD